MAGHDETHKKHRDVHLSAVFLSLVHSEYTALGIWTLAKMDMASGDFTSFLSLWSSALKFLSPFIPLSHHFSLHSCWNKIWLRLRLLWWPSWPRLKTERKREDKKMYECSYFNFHLKIKHEHISIAVYWHHIVKVQCVFLVKTICFFNSSLRHVTCVSSLQRFRADWISH